LQEYGCQWLRFVNTGVIMLAIPGEMCHWFGFVKSHVSPLEEKENQIWKATCGSFLRRMPRS
jgi:hypothetical protein